MVHPAGELNGGALRLDFDRRLMPLEKNIELTRQAVEAVKSINPRIIIEGELGFIGSGSEIHEGVPESSHLLTKTVTPSVLSKPRGLTS
jgi:fructose/tagatose bisphosphate aldolase